MTEQQEDKSRLPLAGLFALVTIAGGLFIYQDISLKTARPIDKEKTSNNFTEKNLVQARLWQDPFEALETHRLKEEKRLKDADLKDDFRNVNKQVEDIKESGVRADVQPGFHIVPVFVDGSPYASGSESRLNERYAVVSALGAAGYVPESGEHIRFFKWDRAEKRKPEGGATAKKEVPKPEIFVPVELFIPKAKLRNKEYGKPVLIVWLKEQDFSKKPLASLNELLRNITEAFKNNSPEITLTYSVLGPRFSAGLNVMLEELRTAQVCGPLFSPLDDAKFYSSWATAPDTFLLDDSPNPPDLYTARSKNQQKEIIEQIFNFAGIEFIRTIRPDAVLAEQLIKELERRRVNLTSCSGKDCPKVALISEWDTLYGRSLPRTFAAVAMNDGSAEPSAALESKINELRRDEWPNWVSRYSYLAGLDGELPIQAKEKKTGTTQGNSKTDHENQAADPEMMERPEGRSQLDYIRRLAQSLKQDQEQNGKDFKAIGVLGGDVYDKLLILQALRPMFPTAIFFTTDLHARLAHPSQWQWTRNLIVASHFGLELQRKLQEPIPPFRDSYQTSLFYAALWALDHFKSPESDYFESIITDGSIKKFSTEPAPRLFEIGTHGAFDISTDAKPYRSDYLSIHPPRSDLNSSSDPWKSLIRVGVTLAAITCLILIAMLISNVVADRCIRLARNKLLWLGLIIVTAMIYGLIYWVTKWMEDPEGEPFTLTDGISAWPTTTLRLVVLLLSGLFLWHSYRKLKDNENELEQNFNLSGEANGLPQKSGSYTSIFSSEFLNCCVGLYYWRPQVGDRIDAANLWTKCVAYGDIKAVAPRVVLQVIVAYAIGGLLILVFGSPFTPCRGPECFAINSSILHASIIVMLALIFYVVDATRICRIWVECITEKKIRWPNGRWTKIAREQGLGSGTDKENLDEWLGIELIAERTKVLGNIIWFPFITIFLLGISRHTYLDNWDFPIALIIIYILNGALIFLNAMTLRGSAEAAKRKAIERLKSKLVALSDQPPDEQSQKRQINWAIDKIENNHKGAFLPFTRHPIFGAAIALPSGGYGLVLLFEYLATAF